MFDVVEYAQVEQYDRKYIAGSDKITKKNDFVTEKRPFFRKNFGTVRSAVWNRLWRLGFAFLS